MWSTKRVQAITVGNVVVPLKLEARLPDKRQSDVARMVQHHVQHATDDREVRTKERIGMGSLVKRIIEMTSIATQRS